MQERVMIQIVKQHWNMQKHLEKVKCKWTWSNLRSKLNNKYEINKKVKRDQKERNRPSRQPKSQQKEGDPTSLGWAQLMHMHGPKAKYIL